MWDDQPSRADVGQQYGYVTTHTVNEYSHGIQNSAYHSERKRPDLYLYNYFSIVYAA